MAQMEDGGASARLGERILRTARRIPLLVLQRGPDVAEGRSTTRLLRSPSPPPSPPARARSHTLTSHTPPPAPPCAQSVIPLKDAETQIFVHYKRLHTFELVHDERRDVCFDAVSEEDKYEWIRFITRAAVGPVNAPVTVHTYYEALGLDESATEDRKSVV